jgi:hypothetical protein
MRLEILAACRKAGQMSAAAEFSRRLHDRAQAG